MIKIKICGTTNLEDALIIAALGADFIGFIFYKKSPRYISPEKAAEIIKHLNGDIKTVGVFVNETIENINKITSLCGLDYVQLHSDEDPFVINQINVPVIKVFRLKKDFDLAIIENYADAVAYLFDTYKEDLYGGTGESFDISIIKDKVFDKPIFISGGLDTENINEVIGQINPYAVDVCSGVEASNGIKDRSKLKDFVAKVRREK